MISFIPIVVKHLFKTLDDQLISLLESLTPEDWNRQTAAKEWTVKDVAAHLLDGNIRALSAQRDKYFGDKAPEIDSYQSLVAWLNQLNADWIRATKRLSPQVLILLHRCTNDQTTAYFESLDPDIEAVFPVSWAGEQKSLNWMHIAREYTEKWHHQQQIREATGREGVLTRELFYPMISTFMLALPYTFRNVAASPGTLIKVQVSGDAGGCWYLQRQIEGWQLMEGEVMTAEITASIEIPQTLAWKLFSKNVRPESVMNEISFSGDKALVMQVLNMVSVMA